MLNKRIGRPPLDVQGKTFGRLTVLHRAEKKNPSDKLHWVVQCACGSPPFATAASALTHGRTVSCGCHHVIHGHARHTTDHKSNPSLTYRSWVRMLSRCCYPNPRYHDYGGRGIRVCDRWRGSFVAFLEDMGERPSVAHSIERIDNNGNYTPENCRWATTAEQSRNKRNSQLLTHNGVTLCATDWAKHLGLSPNALVSRARLFPLEDVFTRVKRPRQHDPITGQWMREGPRKPDAE